MNEPPGPKRYDLWSWYFLRCNSFIKFFILDSMTSNRFPPPPGARPSSLSTFGSVTPMPKIENADISYILDQTLNPEHRSNAVIIDFIMRYLENRDVRQSANAVGIPYTTAKNLRMRKDVHDAITKVTDCMVMKHGIDASEVVEKVKEILDVDPAELQNSDGSFVESLHDLRPEVRRAIKKFECKNEYGLDINGMKTVVGKIIKVEFYARMDAARLLGPEVGVFKETRKVEHDMTAKMADILLEASRRGDDAAIRAREVKQIEGVNGGDVASGNKPDDAQIPRVDESEKVGVGVKSPGPSKPVFSNEIICEELGTE